MAGFRKAKAEQAYLKIGIYGPPGSGKTFTSLLLAEGLAEATGKRIAYVDTERGTDFYCQAVPERRIHPEAFDFDAVYTRSIMEVLDAVQKLDPKTHGVVVLDSMTHLWEACIASYTGRKGSGGQIPFHAWGPIKSPYKRLMNCLMNSPIHVFICGRQGVEYGENEEGEIKAIGLKMKAEGETPYEPHILVRMEAVRQGKSGDAVITAFFEKDRTGVLAQQVISWPNFDNVCKPLLGLLGKTQAKTHDVDETARQDAEAQDDADSARTIASRMLLDSFSGRLLMAKTKAEVDKIGAEITPAVKAQMTGPDIEELRTKYLEAKDKKPTKETANAYAE